MSMTSPLPTRVRARALASATAAALALAACEAPPSGPTYVPFEPYEPAPGTPEAIAYEAGLTRYLGATRVAEESVYRGATAFEFDPATGPMCLRGAPFTASIRDEAGDELLIFLQGGGACWSDFCFAITTAPRGIPPTNLTEVDPRNPLADADVLYLPYCDGSLFSGDAAIDEDGDGSPDRIHRGLANLSAALAVGFERFPAPSRIVLAGSSGGGFGTIMAVFLVRYVYPDVPIFVLDDAGVGIAHPDDPAFVSDLIDEFGARPFLPADCPDCIADGNITGLVDYALDHDPNLRVAAISSHYDFIVADVFLGLPAEAFQAALVAETGALHDEHPDAYRRFLFPGDAHTALLGGVTGLVGSDLGDVELPPDATTLLTDLTLESIHTARANDVLLLDWIVAGLDGDASAWADLVDEPGPLPAWAGPP